MGNYSINIKDAKAIIDNEIDDKTFDSHKFIQKFSQNFELEYIDLLNQHNSQPGEIFNIVHEQIARFLNNNQDKLKITLLPDKVKSLNIFGEETPNANWEK